MKLLLAIATVSACLLDPAAYAMQVECRAPPAPDLRVRFAGQPARDALLESMNPAGLRLVDTSTRREFWSALPVSGATQTIPELNARIGSSFTALHLDADGLHDRIYAGDLAGRLWRLDLRAGAKPSEWMHPTLLADLGAAGGGRGFIAAPDITRIQAADGSTWLSIAIGTANTGPVAVEQRFYVIRDSLDDGSPARPLTEADLEPVMSAQGVSTNGNGYYLRLGYAQVVARALTVNGVTHFSAVEARRNLLEGCLQGIRFNLESVSVEAVQAVNGAVVRHGDSQDPLTRRQLLAHAVPADASVELSATSDADGRLLCLVQSQTIPGCFVDTRPRRTWWRREDAD